MLILTYFLNLKTIMNIIAERTQVNNSVNLDTQLVAK